MTPTLGLSGQAVTVGDLWRVRNQAKGEFTAKVLELGEVAPGYGSALLQVTSGVARSRSEGDVYPGGRLQVRLSLTAFLYRL